MATLGKPKIQIKKSDLNQAVLKKNKSLEAKNKSLELSIKDKEKIIKGLDKEVKSYDSELKSLSLSIEDEKKSLASNKNKVNKIKGEMSKIDSKVSTLKKDESSLSKSVLTLEENKEKFIKDVASLNLQKKQAEKLLVDIDSIESNKKDKTKELESIAIDIIKSQEELASFDSIRKEQKIKLNKDSSKLLSERLLIEESIAEMSAGLDKARKVHNESIRSFKVDAEDRHSDISVLDSLIKQKENEYAVVAANVEVLNNRVSVAEDNIKRVEDAELQAVAKIKSDFERWKLVALEQVARLKLKSKIETIDKAGLMDILNG